MMGRGVCTLTVFLLLFSFSLILEFNQVKVIVEASVGYSVHRLDTSLRFESIQEAMNASEADNRYTICRSFPVGQTRIVTSAMDSGLGTLRWCMQNAVSGDTITFDSSVFPLGNPTTIALMSNLPPIVQGNLTIDASGAGVILNGSQISMDAVGLYVDSENNTIKGLHILQFQGWGIRLTANANNNIISGNNITDNADGLLLEFSSNNSIIENSIVANNGLKGFSPSPNFGYGIELCFSSNNSLKANTLVGNDFNFGLLGSAFSDYFNHVDPLNLVDGKPVYYWVNRRDVEVPQDAGYVALVNCTKITADNLTLTRNMQGILLAYTSKSTVSRNNVTDCWNGILLVNSSSNIVNGNSLTGNGGLGIGLVASSNVTISQNSVTTTEHFGIYLSESSDNRINENNRLTHNSYGILFSNSSYNIVSGNFMASNFGGVGLLSSMTNTVWRNNFVNNTIHGFSESGDANSWDYGFEGNYWSNYTGFDLNHDGIGDLPHILDANNTDNYPLTGMFSSFNATSEHQVQTISNSTISDFQYNKTALSFYVAGENGTTGFCRLCIPTALMNETYRVFVNGTNVSYNLLPVSNSTHSYIYFTYDHSTKEVVIVPEFPSLIILPLFMTITLFAAMVYRKHSGRKVTNF